MLVVQRTARYTGDVKMWMVPRCEEVEPFVFMLLAPLPSALASLAASTALKLTASAKRGWLRCCRARNWHAVSTPCTGQGDRQRRLRRHARVTKRAYR